MESFDTRESVDDDWNVESIWTGFYRLFVSVQDQQSSMKRRDFHPCGVLRKVSKGRGQVCDSKCSEGNPC